MIYIWLAILTLIATIVWGFCRRETFFDQPKNGYIIFNNIMGNPALGGQVFKTEAAALKAIKKMAKSSILVDEGMFAIYQVEV